MCIHGAVFFARIRPAAYAVSGTQHICPNILVNIHAPYGTSYTLTDAVWYKQYRDAVLR